MKSVDSVQSPLLLLEIFTCVSVIDSYVNQENKMFGLISIFLGVDDYIQRPIRQDSYQQALNYSKGLFFFLILMFLTS